MKLRLLYLNLTMGISLAAITSGCHKKVASAPPPPPPVAAPQERAPAPAERPRPAVVAVQPKEAPTPAVASVHTTKTLEDMLNQLLDAYFDYDQADLRS